MPRGGGNGFNGGRKPWNKPPNQRYNNGEYYESGHDDRSGAPKKDNNRRVSFKPSSLGNPSATGRPKNRHFALALGIQEDFDMGGGGGGEGGSGGMRSSQYSGRGGNRGGKVIRKRRGSPVPSGPGGGRKKLIAGTSGWYQVTIPYGQKYEKEFILKSLLDVISPEIFIPHYYKTEGSAATFFVDDLQMAECLLNADRKLSMPDGFKMMVRVRNSIPQVQMDATSKERMKLAMVKRYNAGTKALDLTKFHADPDLSDIFCALFRPTIMLAAIDIIAQNIPDLEALNLHDNKIHILDHMKCMSTKLPHLKILYLGNNRINRMNALDVLKDLPLVELVLEGNPVKDRSKHASVYVSEVRKIFPKLLKLDHVELPPQIGFDVGELQMPPSKSSFFCNNNGAEVIRCFLEQYYIIFDSNNRQPLLDAYHENAMISLTVNSGQQNQRFTSYMHHNRNLLRYRELEGRCRQLKVGRLPVVSFLTELPATQHDPQSFAVDLTLSTPQLLMVTLTGVFREKSKDESNSRNEPLRSFQRSMVIVPMGAGFCIRNEILHICTVTPAQVRGAFKPAVAAPVAAAPIANNMPAAAPVAANLDESGKMHLIKMMSQESGMNFQWSKQCLEETNWDYQRAGFIFAELQKNQKIPPEAFVK